jgi:hypothetical protein
MKFHFGKGLTVHSSFNEIAMILKIEPVLAAYCK